MSILVRWRLFACMSLALLSGPVLATEASSKGCATAVDTVSIYRTLSNLPAAALVEQYQKQVQAIKQQAAKLRVQEFQFTLQEMTVNQSQFDVQNFDATVALAWEFSANYQALVGFLAASGAQGFTTSRYARNGCAH